MVVKKTASCGNECPKQAMPFRLVELQLMGNKEGSFRVVVFWTDTAGSREREVRAVQQKRTAEAEGDFRLGQLAKITS